jgi:hypothetical protein
MRLGFGVNGRVAVRRLKAVYEWQFAAMELCNPSQREQVGPETQTEALEAPSCV